MASGWPRDLPKLLFTGRACQRGHISPRRVSGYYCRACEMEDRGTPEAKAKERAYNRRPDVVQRRREKEREAFTDPAVREANRLYLREYYSRPEVKEAHRHYMRENVAKRDACKLHATPDWLTDAQRDDIKAIYDEAVRLTANTGIPHHVDHIVPPRHPDVCGLHVPWNLQILTADDNQRKSNSFDGTMDNEGWRT